MSFFQILIPIFGAAVCQGLPNFFPAGKNLRFRLLIFVYSFCMSILCVCYSGLIVATLLDKKVPEQINTFKDLIQEDAKIIVKEKTFMQEHLVNSDEYEVRRVWLLIYFSLDFFRIIYASTLILVSSPMRISPTELSPGLTCSRIKYLRCSTMSPAGTTLQWG